MDASDLFDKDSAEYKALLIKDFLESALEAEMEDHLSTAERTRGNKRKG